MVGVRACHEQVAMHNAAPVATTVFHAAVGGAFLDLSSGKVGWNIPAPRVGNADFRSADER